MSEKAKEIRMVSVDYICDECQKGLMIPSGIVFDSYPAQYQHECNACHATRSFREHYPVLRYEIIA